MGVALQCVTESYIYRSDESPTIATAGMHLTNDIHTVKKVRQNYS